MEVSALAKEKDKGGVMRINSPESYTAYQVEIAQEWRAKHNLPKVSDATAVTLYYTIPENKECETQWKQQSKQQK